MKKINVNKTTTGVYYFRRHCMKFKMPETILTDQDLVDLFMGFVGLIKKSAEVKAEFKYKNIIKDILMNR